MESSKLDAKAPQARHGLVKGYVRGSRAAAEYLDIDRKTFRSWREDQTIADDLRRLLRPRVIRGESYYRIVSLDRFMDPINNIDDEMTFRGVSA
jgi:hypothetical protein